MKDLLRGFLCFLVVMACCCFLVGCGKSCHCDKNKCCPCKPCPCKDKCPCPEGVNVQPHRLPPAQALQARLHVTPALAERLHLSQGESVCGPIRRAIHHRRHRHCRPCYRSCKLEVNVRPPVACVLSGQLPQAPGGAVTSAG